MNRPRHIAIAHLTREDLEPICRTLNDKTETGDCLRGLVERWRELRFDTIELLRQDRALNLALQGVCKVNLMATQGGALIEIVEVKVQPQEALASFVDETKKWLGRDPKKIVDYRASLRFVSLLLNPYRMAISAPCARCGKYWIKQRTRTSNNKFCKECRGPGNVMEVYKADRERKLNRVRAYIAKLDQSRKGRLTERSWKELVKEATGVSLSFLTRAVNSGELRPPKATSR